MKKIYQGYIASFNGLSKEVWWLALITLINRAGTMVIPFLSLYLTKSLNFTLGDVGWIMTAFGLGSVAGSWLGGKLTDTIGYYKVMAGSLILSSLMFISLQFYQSFWSICFGVFITILVADAFRPAIFVALNAYSKPKNKTRSLTLIRLAINLGFSVGPAVGGIIITTLGYAGLFWIDGITCFFAGILLLYILNPKKARIIDEVKTVENPQSAYKDYPYWIFFFAMGLFGFIFLQYFSTVPIFYEKVHGMSEDQIGLLLGMNGFVIFLFEMPLVKFFETKTWSNIANMLFGAFLTTISMLLLNMSEWIGILVFGMLFMTLGEMIAFPFSNAFALKRAKKGNAGEYMALYSIAFSFSHIFGHNSGLQLIEKYGFETTWYVMTALGLVCCLLLIVLRKKIKAEVRTEEERTKEEYKEEESVAEVKSL